MSRIKIGDVNIPENKPIRIALSHIRGMGKKDKPKSVTNIILKRARVNPLIKAKELSDEQKMLINQELDKLVYKEKLLIDEDLKKEIKENIKEKININCYQGRYHSMGKKVNGQSSRRNNRNRPN
jgi:small subunit ribosomal protein S13